MIRRMIRRPVASAVGIMVGIMAAAGIAQLAIAWWMGESLILQSAIAIIAIVIGVLLCDNLVEEMTGMSPISGVASVSRGVAGVANLGGLEPRSPREPYRAGWIDRIKQMVARGGDGEVTIDEVQKRDPKGAAQPEIERTTSTSVYGQTGVGKSTFVKTQIDHWDLSEPVIAHAISQPGGSNEFSEFFRNRAEVIEISSRNSDVRWDPFLDADEEIAQMENIAHQVFSSRDIKVTGWSESVRSMLTASTIVTNAEYGDFARLPDVLKEGPDEIIEKIGRVPNAELVAATLSDLGDDERRTVYTNLLNRVRPILMSDVFEPDLPRLSLSGYFEGGDDRVVVLDNVTEDDYAAGFWRFFLESSIETARRTEGRQQFVIDEVPALPKIKNLKDLASAGRSEGVRAMIIAQDTHQMNERYGDMKNSIWANTPNRVMFRPGDPETAELAIKTLGEVEMKKTTVSSGEGDEATTASIEQGSPLLSGDLMHLDAGEALVDTPYGWWVCKITEQDL